MSLQPRPRAFLVPNGTHVLEAFSLERRSPAETFWSRARGRLRGRGEAGRSGRMSTRATSRSIMPMRAASSLGLSPMDSYAPASTLSNGLAQIWDWMPLAFAFT